MSIATEVSRLQTDRNTIRNKLVELGLAASTDKLTKLAIAIDGIVKQGAANITIIEGESYTIPAGYHSGSGTVQAVSGGGNYTLQTKTVTPTKNQQNITSDEGYFGLSGVTVEAIPDAYQDVSSVTAAQGDVLTGKIIVTSDGTVLTGNMLNNGAVSKTLDVTTISYTVPKGYHSGTGVVKITLETKSATPSKETQTITPTAGKVLSSVTVNPIPDDYQDVTGVTATAGHVLDGQKIVTADGTLTDGTMPNNGKVTQSLNTNTKSYTIPEGYHDGTGSVSITTETKSATPTKSTQTVNPSTGSVLSSVTVNPIPEKYQDVSGVTSTAAQVLYGSKFVTSTGVLTDGAMPNNGSTSAEIDGLTTMSVIVPAGYTTGGTISLTGDIEEALAAI